MARADRIAGAAVIAFALALWFIVIPDQVDKADYGWMRPRTLPYILTAALFLLGIVLTLVTSKAEMPSEHPLNRKISIILGLAGLGIFVMAHWGFAFAAPLLAGTAAWLVGERRWLVLLAAGGLVPLAIWILVAYLLGRPLP